jgi:exodeoxyribonuclease VII small subunit
MKKAQPPEASPALQFESALKELEEIVAKMERGDLPLEESLQLFERGTQLSRQCRQALETAELKIKNLLDGGQTTDAGDATA